MKRIALLALAACSLTTHAAIYGADDRRETFQVPQLRTIVKSVAAVVPRNFLVQNRNGSWQRHGADLLAGSPEVNACANVRFARQPIASNCTAFLISKRRVMTAGHCVFNRGIMDNDRNAPFCRSFAFVFDYGANAQDGTFLASIPAKNVYTCTRVVRAENIESRVNGRKVLGNDFAILELDRDVPAEFAPLSLVAAVPKLNEQVYTIGHPSGLPAKYSGLGRVHADAHPKYYETFLDTLSGNSGGPVLDQQNRVRGILVSGHPVDYVMTPRGCYVPNVCNANGTSCTENAPADNRQLSNFVQKLDATVPYLRR